MKCYLDKPSIKKAEEEEMSAEKIMTCDYYLLLYQDVPKIYDQTTFAESKGKKIYSIDVSNYGKHALVEGEEIEEYLGKFLHISEHDKSEFKCTVNSSICSTGSEVHPDCLEMMAPATRWRMSRRVHPGCLEMIVKFAVSMVLLLTLVHIVRKILTSLVQRVIQSIGPISETIITSGKYRLIYIMIGMACTFIALFLLGKIIVFIFSPTLYCAAPLAINDDNCDSKIGEDSYDIFISYAHDSEQHQFDVSRLVDYLLSKNYKPWFDGYMTRSIGGPYNEMIAVRILECNCFILLINQDYVDSEYCRDEFFYARGKNKYIIPVFLEKTQLTPGMEMRLMQQIQCVNLYEFSNIVSFYECLNTVLSKLYPFYP